MKISSKKKKAKFFFSALLILIIILPHILFSNGNKDKNAISALQTITQNELLSIVKYLSSWEISGRLPGSEGYDKAAHFVAEYFKLLKLKPVAGNGYYQHLHVEYNHIDAPVTLALVVNDSIVKNFELGKNFVCRGFTGSSNFIAPVVFCGYGVTSTENNYDDYAGIDVHDKVVLIFKPAPKWKPNSASWGNLGFPRVKTTNAYKHGAVGVLFVSHPKDWQTAIIGSVFHGPGTQIENVPQLHIDISAANEFLKKRKKSVSDLQKLIDSTKTPASFNLNVLAKINVKAKYEKEKATKNVIGFLEGNDPLLKEEIVIVGAHLDHVGMQAGKIYFPGANDNASGVACVLQIAKVFAHNKIKPKRSILFIAFASEEQGLFGSNKYISSPLFPLEKTVAMINFDCVGIGDSIRVSGGKDFPKLFQMAYQHRRKFNLLSSKTGRGGGADANPFHKAKIPNLYFVTTNGYQYLHQTNDTVETLNGKLLESVAKLGYLTVWNIANGDYKRERFTTTD